MSPPFGQRLTRNTSTGRHNRTQIRPRGYRRPSVSRPQNATELSQQACGIVPACHRPLEGCLPRRCSGTKCVRGSVSARAPCNRSPSGSTTNSSRTVTGMGRTMGRCYDMNIITCMSTITTTTTTTITLSHRGVVVGAVSLELRPVLLVHTQYSLTRPGVILLSFPGNCRWICKQSIIICTTPFDSQRTRLSLFRSKL